MANIKSLQSCRSCCKKNQKIIISKDKGSHCEHRANNPVLYTVSQYHIDGDVITGSVDKCDFLLLNETKRNAYYIELKGSDVIHAIDQVMNTESLLKNQLSSYQSLYRIVYHTGTLGVNSSTINRWKEKCGLTKDKIPVAVVKQMRYEEKL